MPRVSEETLKKLNDFLDSLPEAARAKCALCNETLTHIVKTAEAQTGAGTATVTRAIAHRVNEGAVEGDKVTEGALQDRVRTAEQGRRPSKKEKMAQCQNNPPQTPPTESANDTASPPEPPAALDADPPEPQHNQITPGFAHNIIDTMAEIDDDEEEPLWTAPPPDTLMDIDIEEDEELLPGSTIVYADAPEDALPETKAETQIQAPAHNHRAQGTGENEWYTPSEYIDAARTVLGDIDLDPATSAMANETVKAKSFFNIEDNGLEKDWYGRVWLNPPYAQPHIKNFANKLAEEVAHGNVVSAIALTHNYTDTAWFHTLANACQAICFTRGRIAFLNPEGAKAAPTQGQAFFYFGEDIDSFVEAFSEIGIVVSPIKSEEAE